MGQALQQPSHLGRAIKSMTHLKLLMVLDSQALAMLSVQRYLRLF
ncbi:MAG: hypothetical protein LZF86_140101 [Nitrospira sp.]|nr:MAG: hypothetical protein LZF86_140101 [Nitrospira sp.]